MTRTEQAEVVFNETKEALQLIYNTLNSGQQNKIIKEEQVKTLLERYNII